MKKLFALLALIALVTLIYGQAPEKMSYQCVVRNASGALVTNQPVGIRISVLQGSATGTVVFSEIYSPIPHTNSNGLVSLEIGGGTPVTGSFSSINWSVGPFFLKTETDPQGGTNYTITGTSQILSVPYALHAGSVASYAETDPVYAASPASGISTSSIAGWNTSYGWGNHATAGYLTTETDGIVGNEISVVTNSTLLRSGSGTNASPYSVALNLDNTNSWTGPQTFTSSTVFPGSGIWNSAGNVGIGTTSPTSKLQILNGNMVIERPLSVSTIALGSVAGTTQRIFAGDGSGGSLNTNYNQVKLTADPANSEELLRLHTGADAMSNSGTAAINFGQFNLSDMAAIKAVNEGGQPLGRTAGLSFWTEPAGTGVPLQERMRIAGTGNVGIGTTSPVNKLDVNGVISAIGGNSTNWNTAYSWGNHATSGYLTTEVDGIIGNEISNVTNSTLLRTGSGTNASPFSVALNLGNANSWTGSQTFTTSTFFPGSGIWGSDGNAGIGTATPTARLEVVGNVKMSGSSSATAGLSVTGPILGGPPAVEGISGGGGSVKGQLGTSGGVGVFGTSNNGNGAAVWGEMTAGGLVTSSGVYGKVAGTTGSGVFGDATSVTGTNFGVYGRTSSATGWGLYTPNNMYAGGKISIGTTSTTSKLQVEGLPVFPNNSAAVTGGLTAGAFYRTGGDPDFVCVVH